MGDTSNIHLLTNMFLKSITHMTAEREYGLQKMSRSDYKNVLSSTFSDLLTDNEFTDVTLVSHDDEQIKAHKVILCSASAFFRRIIVNNPHQHPLIYLKNVDMKIGY